MATIPCPACGREIWDKSTRCIHCGTPIFVCPECGHIAAGEGKICENCGFVRDAAKTAAQAQTAVRDQTAVPNEAATQPTAPKLPVALDVVDLWLINNPQERPRRKKANIVARVTEILACVLIVGIVIWFIIMWNDSQKANPIQAAEMALRYPTYSKIIWILAIAEIILMTIGFSASIYAARWDWRCLRWLKRQKVDVRSMLKMESADLFIGSMWKFREYGRLKFPNLQVRQVYYSALKNTNVIFMIETILMIIIEVVTICFTVFLTEMTNQLISLVLTRHEITSLDPSAWFIAGAFMEIFSALILVVYRFISGKIIKNYLKQEMQS